MNTEAEIVNIIKFSNYIVFFPRIRFFLFAAFKWWRGNSASWSSRLWLSVQFLENLEAVYLFPLDIL